MVFAINIAQNLREMLQAFQAAAPALNLNNPEFADGSPDTGIVFRILRGPWQTTRRIPGLLYNVRDLLANHKSHIKQTVFRQTATVPYPQYQTYTCGELSPRIITWAIHRRFGTDVPEDALAMNGIEEAHYAFAPIHLIFGFHLSSEPPGHDPRFIDPWWNQRVDENVILTYWNEVKILPTVLLFW
ncbi:MAG: hypothetical protein AB2L14_11960 [Candidatus Xenobiia bacterium LiM19]